MTEVQRLASFVTSIRFEDIPLRALEQLKIRVLDSLGVALGALTAPPLQAIRALVNELGEPGGRARATLIGGGGGSPDHAAFYNGALVRYLDFMDSYLAPGETFHPSDNLGAVLAAAEYAQASGRELLTALAVAYEVQALLSEAAPVRARGFDHTTQGAYAAAAGTAKALRLDASQTAHAIAMSGAANNALRVTRTGRLSHWKGLAYPNTAASATFLALLARQGITGPLEVFEGNKGFKQSIAGSFEVDWRLGGFEGITRSIVKKYNAEIHAQSAIEGALELRARYGFDGREVRSVSIGVFQAAYDIIGGGEEGPKTEIRTKEEADHSLPYMIAVALLDGELGPEQYDPERIAAADVQNLLQAVHVYPDPALTARFPDELGARIGVQLRDGRHYEIEKRDYEGFHTRPMSWDAVSVKFRRLARGALPMGELAALEESVARLEETPVQSLTRILAGSQFRRGIAMKERAFSFIPINERGQKPRACGLTEIRGPYYSVMGRRYLADILETMGEHVDGLKFAGGSFRLMPRERVRELIDLAHTHGVYVSTGGWIERVLGYGAEMVSRYMEEVKNLGFDVIELSTGFISLPADDLLRLVEKARALGLKPKPELGVQFGAGGATAAGELESEGIRDVQWLIQLARRCVNAGAEIIMIESEGITESVKQWRMDIPTQIIQALGLEQIMFEAAEPAVFEWYVKNYGRNVNLFVDHSQIVQLEALRSGIWGTKSSWGRIASFAEEPAARKKRAA